MAAGLAARGFAKGDVLALSSPNLPEYAVAMYGAMAAGGVVTGASPLLTARELAGQLADGGASVLVTVPPFLEVAREAAARAGVGEVLVFGEAEGATPFAICWPSAVPARCPHPAGPGRPPYSSGSPGLPRAWSDPRQPCAQAADQAVMAHHRRRGRRVAVLHAIGQKYPPTPAGGGRW